MPDNNKSQLKSIKEVEEEIIKEFQELVDIDAKYVLLFKLGTELPPMDPALKTDQNLVNGCLSKLWFHLAENQGKLTLTADSDSLVIKAIAALIARLVEGRTPADIQFISMDFIDQLEIWKLASERNNGLMAMLAHIKGQAERILKENNPEEFGSEL